MTKQTNICTRCNKNELEQPLVLNALSRKDNETYICTQCGTAEAMEEFEKYNAENNS